MEQFIYFIGLLFLFICVLLLLIILKGRICFYRVVYLQYRGFVGCNQLYKNKIIGFYLKQEVYNVLNFIFKKIIIVDVNFVDNIVDNNF